MARNPGSRPFAHKTGQSYEGGMVADEEQAHNAIRLRNYLSMMEKAEARETRRKEVIKAKITLPKLKFMGQ